MNIHWLLFLYRSNFGLISVSQINAKDLIFKIQDFFFLVSLSLESYDKIIFPFKK